MIDDRLKGFFGLVLVCVIDRNQQMDQNSSRKFKGLSAFCIDEDYY